MNKIAIATISRARTETEETLLRRSLTALSNHRHPVFVTDGGSSESFVDWLRTLPNLTVLPAASGLVAQACSSLVAAAKSGAPFLFYTEPDKQEFFESELTNLLNNVRLNENTGVVLAARSQKAFASFPAFQQVTEKAINRCCAEQIGLKTDYCYGPFLLNAKLAAFVSHVPAELGWGWRPFVFQTAHCLGYSVETVEGDFACPEEQREDDAAERLYRMKQLEQNIRGLVLAAETR